MGCVRTALQVAKSKKLTVLCHFLFSVEIGISGFGSSTSSVFMSVLLWYKMLICYFSIKNLITSLFLSWSCTQLSTCLNTPAAEKRPNFMGKWERTSYVAVTVHWGRTQDGRESFGAHKIASQFTCLLFSQQLLHIRNLFKKQSFLKEAKKNHAYSIICSPTQREGEDDGFSLYVQEIHKSPVLMGI